jgi:hypothetical protein
MSDTPTTHSAFTAQMVFGTVLMRRTARVDGDRVILGCKVARPSVDGWTEWSSHDTAIVYCANERQAIALAAEYNEQEPS